MRPSSKRPVKLNPYWQPQADALYGETAFALAWLEPVWFEDAHSVPDDWSPDLQDRANRAAARGEERDYCDWVHTAYGEDPPGW